MPLCGAEGLQEVGQSAYRRHVIAGIYPTSWGYRQSKPVPLIEYDNASPRSHPVQPRRKFWPLPIGLNVRDEARDIHEVQRARAKDLIGDVHITALGVTIQGALNGAFASGRVHYDILVRLLGSQRAGSIKNIRSNGAGLPNVVKSVHQLKSAACLLIRPKADLSRTSRHVSFVPGRDERRCSN
jgi:hypothetical protein